MALHLATKRDEAATSTPAAAALTRLRAQIADLQAKDASWAEGENTELDHVRTCASEQAALAALTQRRIDAQADKDVLGHTTTDTTALAEQITAARERVNAAVERAALAQAKLVRIRDQRAALREQQVKLNEQFRPLQHAARTERLGGAMATLLSAEAAYVDALQTAFGIAATIDTLAKAAGPQLGFAGQLDVQDLILPRPFHAAFADKPSPLRVDIAAAIAAEANKVAGAL